MENVQLKHPKYEFKQKVSYLIKQNIPKKCEIAWAEGDGFDSRGI
jgi:hypothetical protein